MTVRPRPLIKPDGRIYRIRLSEPLHRGAFGVSLGFAIERALEFPKLLRGCYLLRAISHFFTPLPRVRTSSVPWRRSKVTAVTMNASDFQTDARCLTGRTGLCSGLSFGLSLTHRLGSPRLSDADLPDVLTTLTPTEFTGAGDCLSCEHRPSHNTPEARRLRAFNITRLIRCGSSSFRPVGSIPGTALPSCLAAWSGIRSFRREPPNSTGGTYTHELPHPSRAAAGWPVYRVGRKSFPLFLFFGGAARWPFPCLERGGALTFWPAWSLQMPRRRKTKRIICGYALL